MLCRFVQGPYVLGWLSPDLLRLPLVVRVFSCIAPGFWAGSVPTCSGYPSSLLRVGRCATAAHVPRTSNFFSIPTSQSLVKCRGKHLWLRSPSMRIPHSWGGPSIFPSRGVWNFTAKTLEREAGIFSRGPKLYEYCDPSAADRITTFVALCGRSHYHVWGQTCSVFTVRTVRLRVPDMIILSVTSSALNF